MNKHPWFAEPLKHKGLIFCFALINILGCKVREDYPWYKANTSSEPFIYYNTLSNFKAGKAIELELVESKRIGFEYSSSGIDIGGIDIDTRGVIYLIDLKRREIVSVQPKSGIAKTFVPYGHLKGQIALPFAITVDNDYLWVGDMLKKGWFCYDKYSRLVREAYFKESIPTDLSFSSNGDCYGIVLTKEDSLTYRSIGRLSKTDGSVQKFFYSKSMQNKGEASRENLLFNYTISDNGTMLVTPYETNDYTVDIIKRDSLKARIKRDFNKEKIENGTSTDDIWTYCSLGNKNLSSPIKKLGNYKRSTLFAFMDENTYIYVCTGYAKGGFGFDVYNGDGVLISQALLETAADSRIVYCKPYVVVYLNQMPQPPIVWIYKTKVNDVKEKS
jgi:hypothetical protein